MILCIGVLCVAVLVPVVGRKKVSSEVRRYFRWVFLSGGGSGTYFVETGGTKIT